MNKKIAIIYNTSLYIFKFRINLIKYLISTGYQIITIAPIDDYTPRLEMIGCEHYHINMDSKGKNPLKDFSLIINLIKILNKVKPDIILNYTAKPNIYGTLAGHYCGIPSINNIAGLGTGFVNESFTTKILRVLYRFSQKKAAKIFFQNPDDFSEFENYKMIDPIKCSILPGSGVDLLHFNVYPVPLFNENKFIFLLISRMLYSKGIELLYLAAKRIYDEGNHKFSIHLLGETGVNSSDAIPVSQINEWSKAPFINYLGKTDDVRPHIKSAHCIVLPSFYREGTPRSILEGLAMGKPIITTDMPGCRTTVIEGENGYLIDPQSVDSLILKMKKIMSLDYIQLLEMGTKSRILAVEKFDEKIVIQKYLKEIKRLI